MRNLGACAAWGLWLGLTGTAAAAAEDKPAIVSMRSGDIEVRYEVKAGTFSLLRSGKAFVPQGTFGDFLPSSDRRVTAEPKTLQIEHASGRVVRFTLVDGTPFVLIQGSIHNRTDKPLVVGELVPLAATIDLGTPLSDLRTLGYDGLLVADQPRTRFLSLAAADPRTGAGIVCGWVSHDRASGLVWSCRDRERLRVEPISQYGRVVVPPGKSLKGETLAIGHFDNAAEGLEKYGEEIARRYAIRVKPVPSGYMTWYHARALDAKRMPELAAWCAANLKQYGFDFLQIDDGWQVANRDFTTHNPKGPYPSGMKKTADAITQRGFAAGIWITPFGWDHKRPVFADHQDWFVKRRDGSVYAVTWGGDCLDMSHPAARAFLKAAIDRMSNAWGYKFFKLDGLWAGVAAGILYPDPTFRPDGFGDAVFHDPEMSNLEAFRTGLKTVREASGPESYLLGCTVAQNMRTLGGSIGLVDGIRIGIDSGRSWPGILANVKTSTAMYFLHGRVWHNDPDVLYLDKSFTLDQVREFASWIAITGQMSMVSEWLPDVPAERLEVVRRTIPNHNLRARPVDLFETFPARIWHLRSGEGERRRDAVGLFNWDDKPVSLAVDLARLGLPGHCVAYDFWENEAVKIEKHALRVELRPRSCRVIALRPAATWPQVVSTSRHVTQGIVDLMSESWDGPQRRLRGVSRVVGGDPYELRVMTPETAETWREGATPAVSAADAQAGVTIRSKQAKGLLKRYVIESPSNREVRWELPLVVSPHVDVDPKASPQR